MPEETLFEFERSQTRAEIAARLRSLADDFDAGGPVTLTADEKTTTVTPSDRPDFELEAEREWEDDDEDTAEVSIEAEIEWAEADVETEAEPDTEGETETGGESETPAIEPNASDEEDLPAAAIGSGETIRSLGQFQLYVDRAGKWRWRLVHRNGNIIAASGQGYASRQKAQQGMHSVMRNAPDAEAITVE